MELIQLEVHYSLTQEDRVRQAISLVTTISANKGSFEETEISVSFFCNNIVNLCLLQCKNDCSKIRV